MASVTGLSKIGLPHLSENMDAEDARAIRNYLYQMQEQLQYVLCNLDVENMSEPLRARLNSIDTRLDKLEEDAEITRDGVNALIEWAENVSNAIRFPLPKLK